MCCFGTVSGNNTDGCAVDSWVAARSDDGMPHHDVCYGDGNGNGAVGYRRRKYRGVCEHSELFERVSGDTLPEQRVRLVPEGGRAGAELLLAVPP